MLSLITHRMLPIVLLEDSSSWLDDFLNGIGEAIKDALVSGLTGAFDKIADSLWDIFIQFVLNAVYQLVDYVLDKISTIPLQVINLPATQGLLAFFGQLGWALYITGLILAVFDICIEYQSMGRFNLKRQILPMLTGLLAVNLFNVLPVKLYEFAVDQQGVLQNLIGRLQLASATNQAHASNNVLIEIYAIYDAQHSSIGEQLYVILLLILFIYAVVKVFMANIKRGGILITMIGVGSLYMLSLPRGYTDGFWSWCKQIVALCFTSAMQSVLLYLGCVVSTGGVDQILLGIGIMLAANEVPRILGQFGLDTSAKANLGSAVYTANAAMNGVRSATQIIQTVSKAS